MAQQVLIGQLSVGGVSAVAERLKEGGAVRLGACRLLQVATVDAMLTSVDANLALWVHLSALEQSNGGHQFENAGCRRRGSEQQAWLPRRFLLCPYQYAACLYIERHCSSLNRSGFVQLFLCLP